MIKRINFKKRVMGWYKVEFLRDYLRLFWIHPIFLFEFIFLSGMILKMKKFVIQWRKFDSKRTYIKKDMNIWIFWNFLDFIFIFQAFSRICFIKKLAKSGYLIAWDPRSWRCTRRTCGGATQGHVDTYVCAYVGGVIGLAGDGPMG